MNISVVGLGKLGSPMAACFAAKGHRVIGVDVNEAFVECINRGEAPVFEPGLPEMLTAARGSLTATTDYQRAVENSDITFLIVPTPSREDGFFSVQFVEKAARSIGQALRTKNERHIVVLTSTVMPGDTQASMIPIIEEASGKRCPEDIGVCYSPEFISLGSVIRDYLHPDFVLIGESDQESGDVLAGIYETVCENDPPVARMKFVNAELTKLALNAFVTTKISYANMLAEICEQFDDGHVDAVTSALGLDTRIGPKYLKGSIGYGGPCFPRDSIALAKLARHLGVQAPIPEATHETNEMQVPRLRQLVLACLPENGRVGILGLAYKPHTDVVERSQGVELAQSLASHGVDVVAYDPNANETAGRAIGATGGRCQFTTSAHECARSSDVLVVCSPCNEFRAIDVTDLQRIGNRPTIIDCWRLLDRPEIAAVADYVGIGTGAVSVAQRAVAGTVPSREIRRAA